MEEKKIKRNLQDPKWLIACSVESCKDKNLYAHGLCRFHYERKRKGYELDPPKHTHTKKYTNCIINGCERKHKGRYCAYHWYRVNNDLPLDHKRPKGKSKTIFKDHYKLKKNRLILLKKYPDCQNCGKEKSVLAKHLDGDLTNHNIENLMVVCKDCRYLVGRKNSKYYDLYGYNSETLIKMFKISYGKLKGLSKAEIKKRIRAFEKTEKFDKQYKDKKQVVL